MRVFAVGWAYRGGKDEGWGYDELGRWVGLGCGIGIGSRSGLGGWGVSSVGIVKGELWIYPHSATPLIPTQSPYNTMSSQPTHDRIRTARHTPFSPPGPNSHPPYHPTPLPRQLYSNQFDPTLDHIHNPPSTIPPQKHHTADTSFVLLDVTCSPRELVVHMQILACHNLLHLLFSN